MFQAQRLTPGRARPVILHGPRTLPTIATEGWVPFAHAMTGFQQQAPAWCGEDLRPVVGTSCDVWLLPDPLTEREQLRLLPVAEINDTLPAQQLCPTHMARPETRCPECPWAGSQ